MMGTEKKRLFVVDAMAMVFRSYYAFGQRPLSTASGFPTSAIYGSASFLMRLIEKEKPDYFVIASDSKGPTFRHELYSQYKANRTEMPEDLAQQIAPFFELLEHMGCQVIKEEGVEADDLIASLVKQYASDSLHCYIVSGDKDFLQLVDENTSLYSPKKGGAVDILGPKEVVEKLSCSPSQVIDYLALTGDAADNIPGVAGIGPKGASKLLGEFQTLENILSNVEKVKNKRQHESLKTNKEMALLSQKLVILKEDLETIPSLESSVFPGEKLILNENLEDFFRRYELISLVNKMTLNKRALTQENQPKLEKQDKEAKSKPKKKDIEEKSSALEENKKDYKKENFLVKDQESFLALKNTVADSELFSFDTETTGLDITLDKPIGASFSFQNKKNFYLPLAQEKLSDDLSLETVLSFLKSVFIDETKIKICHNVKFDRAMLKNLDIELKAPYDDTMLMSFILDPGFSHSLDNLSKNHLKIEKIKIKELLSEAGT